MTQEMSRPCSNVVHRSIVVVAITAVHNRLSYTQRCLAALRQGAKTVRLTMIIVDDGSTDGTKEWLAAANPDAIVLTGDGNLWFGGAIEKAIAHTVSHYPTADYVLILNNDTFVRPGSIDEMVSASDHRFSVAAALWLDDRRINGSGGFLWHWWRGLYDICITPRWRTANESGEIGFICVDAVATTCVLHPMKRIKEAAPVDLSRHPQNRYDTLLSARIRAVGGQFLVSCHPLADHAYGAIADRPTLRNSSICQFIRATFCDAKSVYHLPYSIDAIWNSAPTRWHALPVIARQIALFLRIALFKAIQAILCCIRIKI